MAGTSMSRTITAEEERILEAAKTYATVRREPAAPGLGYRIHRAHEDLRAAAIKCYAPGAC